MPAWLVAGQSPIPLGSAALITASTLLRGQTTYGGLYSGPGGQTLPLNPASGRSDVPGETEAGSVAAECKGGIGYTCHAGQVSQLRKRLCEAVGMLL